MEQRPNLSEITTELMDYVQNLQDLAGQVSQLGHRITKMSGMFSKFDQNLEMLGFSADSVLKGIPLNESSHSKVLGGTKVPSSEKKTTAFGFSNIIPFPGTGMFAARSAQKDRALVLAPFLARPGIPLPPPITDYRPHLQRDGLILLAWDRRETEMGGRYTAYWVTSMGTPRFYASKLFSSEDFSSARPDHKSYAAEDGIEFYGQTVPACLVHVAPELMMSNPRHGELRTAHIKILESQGSKVDFSFKYLLKTEKNRKTPSKKNKGKQHNLVGA